MTIFLPSFSRLYGELGKPIHQTVPVPLQPPLRIGLTWWLMPKKKDIINELSTTCHLYVHDPPPFITFEIPVNTNPLPIPSFTLNVLTLNNSIIYYLWSIIYHSDFHFTARLFDKQQHTWSYGRQKTMDFLWPIMSAMSPTAPIQMKRRLFIDDKCIYMYMYYNQFLILFSPWFPPSILKFKHAQCSFEVSQTAQFWMNIHKECS